MIKGKVKVILLKVHCHIKLIKVNCYCLFFLGVSSFVCFDSPHEHGLWCEVCAYQCGRLKMTI